MKRDYPNGQNSGYLCGSRTEESYLLKFLEYSIVTLSGLIDSQIVHLRL